MDNPNKEAFDKLDWLIKMIYDGYYGNEVITDIADECERVIGVTIRELQQEVDRANNRDR